MVPVGEETAEALRRKHYNAVLTRIVACHPLLWIVRVKPDAGILAFLPGQYTTLGLGAWEPRVDAFDKELIRPGEERKLILRAYSFCHPVVDEATGDLVDPARLDEHEFYITLLTGADEGDYLPHLTPRLFKLEAGGRLFIGRKVTGHYTLKGVEPDEDVLFAATGTGEAPHNAMIWHLLRSGHRGRLVSVVCTRYEADQGYRDLHRKLEARHGNYTYLSLTTREAHNQGRKIYLQELIGEGILESTLGWRLEPGRCHVFLCGNPAMIGIPKVAGGARAYPNPKGLIEILEARGFNAGARAGQRVDVHYEKYW
jgi:ferredoxin--NADP+ reductase